MKFECQPNCGKCCTGSGFVYLSAADLEILAQSLHWSPKTFELKFCGRDVNGNLHLKNTGDGCIFLDGLKCSIQTVKPTQCHTFPFWPKADMEKLKEWCPGIGVGREYSPEEIKELENETAGILPGHQLISK